MTFRANQQGGGFMSGRRDRRDGDETALSDC